MQKSEKHNPPLGQTIKQPALQQHPNFDHIVAPLASFDTIDLGDDDLTPTENAQHFSNQIVSGNCTQANASSTKSATRPSDLKSLTAAVAREPKSELCDAHDQDLTPTSELTPTKKADNFSPVTSQQASKCQSTSSLTATSTASAVSCPSVDSLNSVDSVQDAVKVNTEPMSSTTSSTPKAKEKKKAKKQRKRSNSSSSSEWSDDDTKKGSSGVSWSRRVHIYGKISKSPTPNSPGLSLPPPPKDPSTKDSPTHVETVEAIDLNTASASKKKAYLKKLQRLQVKTNPIERPRSTTPINIFTLDEYVNYSSPEASPGADKIKIKLPEEEFSPRNAEKDNLCFDFNEEDLFCHTKSGILMSNDAPAAANIQSPRRVLIPPSLTPTSSPSRSAASSPRSPRYIYCPSTNTHFQYPGEGADSPTAVSGLVSNNWVRFDDSSSSKKAVRTLGNAKPQSRPTTLHTATNSRSLPSDNDEILQVHVVEGGNAKRDCSIKILPADKAESSPVLESKVANVVTAIASAIDSVDANVNTEITETKESAEQNSSVKEEDNNQQARHPMPVLQLFPPANLPAVCSDHDYLKLTPEDQYLEDFKVTKITSDEATRIEEMTRGQGSSQVWADVRTHHVTSSNFGTICKATDRRDLKKLAASMVSPVDLKTPAIIHGRKYESVAVEAMEQQLGIHTSECGIFVCPDHPQLAASPDRTIDLDTCVEVKCPFTSKDKKISPRTVPYLRNIDGKLTLDRNHTYYYQIQGQLLCSGRKKCYFVVYTLVDLHLEVIFKDDEFIKTMVEKLLAFYRSYLRPAILQKFVYKYYNCYSFQ